tara:strand:+ start:3998 stop:4117 length:120 start_codon:yes stop_codon:yes gene_type:complete
MNSDRQKGSQYHVFPPMEMNFQQKIQFSDAKEGGEEGFC